MEPRELNERGGKCQIMCYKFWQVFFFILTPPPLVSLLENGAAAAPLLVHFRRIFFLNESSSFTIFLQYETDYRHIHTKWDYIRKKAIQGSYTVVTERLRKKSTFLEQTRQGSSASEDEIFKKMLFMHFFLFFLHIVIQKNHVL